LEEAEGSVEGSDRMEAGGADGADGREAGGAGGADRGEAAEASLSHVRHPHLPRIASASGCSAEVDPAAAEEEADPAAAAEVAAEVDPAAAAKAGVDPTT
jgi:hypothetical protein